MVTFHLCRNYIENHTKEYTKTAKCTLVVNQLKQIQVNFNKLLYYQTLFLKTKVLRTISEFS